MKQKVCVGVSRSCVQNGSVYIMAEDDEDAKKQVQELLVSESPEIDWFEVEDYIPAGDGNWAICYVEHDLDEDEMTEALKPIL